MLLREPLPTTPIQLVVIASGVLLICGGIAQLVHSPAVLNPSPPPETEQSGALRPSREPARPERLHPIAYEVVAQPGQHLQIRSHRISPSDPALSSRRDRQAVH